jgi:nicotinate-nucleotide pyrophosphorylase (carboxylating)
VIEPWNRLTLPDLFARLAGGGLVRRLLELARDEDLGPEGIDLTGSAVESDAMVRARLVARGETVIAGLACVPALLEVFGAGVSFRAVRRDGDRCSAGETVAELTGAVGEVVRVERTLLNLVARLSGVATRTDAFVRAIGGTRARLYDTRKTTPGLRVLEKYAVRCGGGFCHRMGLHDAVMFKDNHIAGVPPERLGEHLASLIGRVRTGSAGPPAFIEVEADTLEQFGAILALPPGLVDLVLLDNMTPAMLAGGVGMRDRAGSALLLEASGGVTLDRIGAIARTGVDRISAGSLTHGAVSADLGLDADG